MLADNLVMLRNLKGMTQEQVAEVAGVSRQSYAKWEQGETVPDIEKCDRLAKLYGISIDALKTSLGNGHNRKQGADRDSQGRTGYV